MKKILILILLVLFCFDSVWSGEFEDTLKKAELRDAEAQYDLGVRYFYGNGVPQNYKKALYLFRQTIDSDAFSYFYLGEIYYQGLSIPKNKIQGIYYYLKAAKIASFQCMGNNMAQHKLLKILDNINITKINDYIYWLTLGAEHGYTDFQEEMGDFYEGEKNYKKAFHWYLKSAKKGYVMSQVMLGQFYSSGDGVSQNYKKAFYWYNKAARQGHFAAQINVGIMYNEGQGVTQDYKQAYVWNSLAAAQGVESANSNRDLVAKKLTPQQLAKAQELAAKMQYKIDHLTESQEQQSSMSNNEDKIIGSGTGFIITRDGYILTCHHVIKDANEIKISVGENTYSAKLIRDDPNNDLALLKINGSFPAIAFSSKRSAKMGQEVFTIGYPNPSLQGVSAKFTKGTINSLTGFQDDLRLYQISIPGSTWEFRRGFAG